MKGLSLDLAVLHAPDLTHLDYPMSGLKHHTRLDFDTLTSISALPLRSLSLLDWLQWDNLRTLEHLPLRQMAVANYRMAIHALSPGNLQSLQSVTLGETLEDNAQRWLKGLNLTKEEAVLRVANALRGLPNLSCLAQVKDTNADVAAVYPGDWESLGERGERAKQVLHRRVRA